MDLLCLAPTLLVERSFFPATNEILRNLQDSGDHTPHSGLSRKSMHVPLGCSLAVPHPCTQSKEGLLSESK